MSGHRPPHRFVPYRPNAEDFNDQPTSADLILSVLKSFAPYSTVLGWQSSGTLLSLFIDTSNPGVGHDHSSSCIKQLF